MKTAMRTTLRSYEDSGSIKQTNSIVNIDMLGKIVFRADIDPHARGESNDAIRTEIGRLESLRRPH